MHFVLLQLYKGHLMDISAQGALPHLDTLMKDFERYDVTQHALELDTYGFTVVPPEKLGVDDAFIERLRNALISTAERRHGVEIGDPSTAGIDEKVVGRNAWRLLFEDDAFVEASLNPVGLSLIRFLLGQRAVLSGNLWIIKPRTESYLKLHSDAPGITLGAGTIAHVVNASWLCTDYNDVDDGPTVLVPGSFRFGRKPLPHESEPLDTPFPVVPLQGKAGSLAIWHGGTWHGSVPRKRDGLRVTYVQNWMRSYMKQIHHWDDAPAELIKRHPELPHILGLDSMYPWREQPDPDRTFVLQSIDPYA